MENDKIRIEAIKFTYCPHEVFCVSDRIEVTMTIRGKRMTLSQKYGCPFVPEVENGLRDSSPDEILEKTTELYRRAIEFAFEKLEKLNEEEEKGEIIEVEG